MKGILTLVGKKQARVGYKFRFLGSCEFINDCNDSLRNLCLGNLEKNHVYEIIEVRKIHHNCKAHKDGVTVVKVKPSPIKVAIKSRIAHEGSIITYKASDCEYINCPLYECCVPIEFKKNSKFKCHILKVEEKNIDYCKKNYQMMIVKIEKI